MEIWTPRQQLSREKWRKQLVAIQYDTGESADQLHKRLHDEGEEKGRKLDENVGPQPIEAATYIVGYVFSSKK